ncbi:MAG TPA: ABC transporter permease [Saprospiraceae bacterium]|nr:ABC transporter permease [Saprospiraceae bacterium]
MQILRLFLSRVASGLLILISVVVLIASIIYLAPVDPTRLSFGQRSDSATIAQKKQELGLDKPLYAQLVDYLADLSPVVFTQNLDKYDGFVVADIRLSSYHFLLKKSNLRVSYQTGNKVSTMVRQALPKTIILALASFIFAAIFGILFGVISAAKKDTWIDKSLLAVATLGISVPSYVAAIVMAIIFHNITGLNIQGSIFEINDYGDDYVAWKNLILPAIALGIRPVSIIMQLTRSAVLEVMGQDYIRTAKAKGLSFIKIMWRHIMPNAMNPIVTSLTGWLASLLAGAYFVEKVFNFKGIGELTINGLINYDLPVILATVIFICSVFIVINIITDMLYILIDPRQRT